MNDKKRFEEQGRLEEYKSLRSEMLVIISGRLWGQVTYVVLASGIFSYIKEVNELVCLIFLILSAIPFLFHARFREEARFRMADYLREKVEAKIPGLGWEEYLDKCRNSDKKNSKARLGNFERIKHIFCIAGIYFVVACFCLVIILNGDNNVGKVIAGVAFSLLIGTYFYFFKLYDKPRDKKCSDLSAV